MQSWLTGPLLGQLVPPGGVVGPLSCDYRHCCEREQEKREGSGTENAGNHMPEAKEPLNPEETWDLCLSASIFGSVQLSPWRVCECVTERSKTQI